MGDEGILALEDVPGSDRDVLEFVCGLEDAKTGRWRSIGQEYVTGAGAQVA